MKQLFKCSLNKQAFHFVPKHSIYINSKKKIQTYPTFFSYQQVYLIVNHFFKKKQKT